MASPSDGRLKRFLRDAGLAIIAAILLRLAEIAVRMLAISGT
jgi:hypothetical protein